MFKGMDAILGPRLVSERGIEGKILSLKYAQNKRCLPRHLPGHARLR